MRYKALKTELKSHKFLLESTQSRGETPSVASLEAARASVTAENSPQTHEIRFRPIFFKAPSYKVPCPAGTKTLKPNDEAAKGDLAKRLVINGKTYVNHHDTSHNQQGEPLAKL